MGSFGLQIRNLHAKLYIFTCSNRIFMKFSKSGLGCAYFSGFKRFVYNWHWIHVINFLEATVKRSDENQYRSWGYCTYEVPWNDHSFKFTIFYSKILGDWNRRIFFGQGKCPKWIESAGVRPAGPFYPPGAPQKSWPTFRKAN